MDILIIVFLTLINGMLAMSEMAIVSSRKTKLQQMADEGVAGAARALKLANDPGVFLSTVQVGITAITIASGAFGEAALSKQFAAWLNQFTWMTPYQNEFALIVTVTLITFFSVVFGELVPKRMALSAPETIASLASKPLSIIAAVFGPFVRLFSLSSDGVLKLFGVRHGFTEAPVSEEEIKVMIEQGAEQGVLEQSEETLVRNVFRLDDLRVSAIMTHRVNMFVLDVNDSEVQTRERLSVSSFSRLPVCKGDTDNILGVVNAKDLLAKALRGEPLDLLSAALKPIYVPGTITAMQLLENFQGSKTDVAFVIDEHGEVQGMATLADVMQAIVGDVAVNDPTQENLAVKRDDGSWLIDGGLPLEQLEEILEFDRGLRDDEDHYHTVAGFVMTKLGRVPREGDKLVWHELQIEVVDMDRNRIDKVIVSKIDPLQEADAVSKD